MKTVIHYISESKLNKTVINSVSGFKKLVFDKLNNLIEEKESEVLDLSGLEFNINDLSGAFEIIGQQPEDLRYLEKIDVSNWKFNKTNVKLDDLFAFKPYYKFGQNLSDEELYKNGYFGSDYTARINKESIRKEVHRSKKHTSKADAYLSKIEIVGLDTWDVSNVTSMNRLFYGFNSKIGKNDLSKWNVSKVKSLDEAFAFSNVELDISDWKLNSLKSFDKCFYESDSIIDLPEDMKDMKIHHPVADFIKKISKNK